MPRKQRFKPSRKPKPVQTVEVTEIQRTAQSSADVIESAQPARTPQENSAVIEDAASEQDRA